MTSTLRPRARRAARRALQVGVKSAAEAADLVRRPRRGVTVLVYHRVGGSSASEVDLPAGVFAAQMAALSATGRACALDAALDHLARPDPPPGPDPVVVTFDDGTADFTDHALPVLVEHGVPALVYVATDFVERQIPFPWGAPPVTWAALADARSTGLVTVGSHTHTHRLLDRIEPAMVHDELDRSIELIGERLGCRPAHFAYPKALAPSPAADAAVRARFTSAALAGTHANEFGATDPHRLARSPIQVADGQRWFRRKADGGMALEDRLRQLLLRSRYAGATT